MGGEMVLIKQKYGKRGRRYSRRQLSYFVLIGLFIVSVSIPLVFDEHVVFIDTPARFFRFDEVAALSSMSKTATKSNDTIAITVAVTECPDEASEKFSRFMDCVVVLKHSIQKSFQMSSKYDKYEMIAITHRDDVSESCQRRLSALGFKVLRLPPPVSLSEIRNPEYAKIIENSGCCGEKEFLKLYGYNMTEYKVVVQMDMDTMILRPLDDLYDAILMETSEYPSSTLATSSKIMPGTGQPEEINAIFARDFAANSRIVKTKDMRPPNKIQVQGGFLVLRPDAKSFEELLELIREGDFVPGRGWGKDGWGGIKAGGGGSDRFQGLMSYFYSGIHPKTAVELHPCYYYSNGNTPYSLSGNCTTMESKCEDCRYTPLTQIHSFHFGGCKKPWSCPVMDKDFPKTFTVATIDRSIICRPMQNAWHKLRYEWEASVTPTGLPRFGMDPNNITDYYYGHCVVDKVLGKYGYRYIPIDQSLFPR